MNQDKLQTIFKVFSEHFGITYDEFTDRSRKYPKPFQRSLFGYICFNYFKISHTEIGKFSKIDRTTVAHSINVINGHIKWDNYDVNQHLDKLLLKLNSEEINHTPFQILQVKYDELFNEYTQLKIKYKRLVNEKNTNKEIGTVHY